MGESQAGERPLSKPKVDGTWGNKLRLSSGLCRHTDTCGVHASTDTCKNTCNVYACMCTHTRHSHWEGVTCKFTHTQHSDETPRTEEMQSNRVQNPVAMLGSS